MDKLTTAPGAYLLVIDLDAPLALDVPRGRAATLAAGRYGYCGSAYGPGGIGARVHRHLRRVKAIRWHIARLTASGRIVAVQAEPGGDECALMDSLRALPGVSMPIPGFGSSDCRRCPSHPTALAPNFTPPGRVENTE